MTVAIIRSRRFDLLNVARCVPVLLALSWLHFPKSAEAASIASKSAGSAKILANAGAGKPKLPVLSNIGVVPLSVEEPEGQDPKLEPTLERLAALFPDVVRASRRFRVVDDEVVASLWASDDGRTELQGEFEVDALVSLTAAPMSDVVSLTARLMDGKLKTLVIEQDRVPRAWLVAADKEEVTDRLERLVFALFNRIPVDVSVTSVQGPYITISGGSEQGVQVGDHVVLERVWISSLHPANGGWVDYEKRKLGSAEVLEVKTHNSVARLEKLSYDDAVQVGDGARVPAIRSRHKFARPEGDDEGFKDSGKQDAVIVPPVLLGPLVPPKPIKPGADPKSAPKVADATPVPQQQQVAENAPEEEDKPKTDVAAPPPPPEAEIAEDDDRSFFDKLKSPQDKWLDDAHIYAGPHWWAVRGPDPSNASGKFPLWLINSVGMGVTRTLLYKIKTGFGGGILFGNSAKGSYTGYDANARLYWEEQVDIGGRLITAWRAGGYGSFSGLSVSKEGYGGGDWLRGGVFGGLGGVLGSEQNGAQAYDWFADFALMPLNIGRFGYGGKQYVVESAFGTRLGIGAYQRAEIFEHVNVGAMVEMSDERLTLKNSRRPHLSDYFIKALAKYAF